ncbi:MAG: hypothetical protein ABH954_01270 [Candidatus Omnitrophota bacterium]
MEKKIKVAIRALGILDLIIGALSVSFAVYKLLNLHPEEYHPIFMLLMVILIPTGIFIFWTGIESLKLKANARICNLFFYFTTLFFTVPPALIIIFAPRGRIGTPFVLMTFLQLIINILILIFLMHPEVKEQFKDEMVVKGVKCEQCDSSEVQKSFLGGSGKLLGILFIAAGIYGMLKIGLGSIWFILIGIASMLVPKYKCKSCGKKFS